MKIQVYPFRPIFHYLKDNRFTKKAYNLMLISKTFEKKNILLDAISKEIAHPADLIKKENNQDLLVKLKIWEQNLTKYK